ncbi:hypothetical protein [Oceanibium sediminis]|uniref:hypothetical protein n=1 Tax=Oceanibium sediminis TaxID=2026339 RepID=UPI000DD3462C|nr:hypothetical protein [Oceanibium sediminis]
MNPFRCALAVAVLALSTGHAAAQDMPNRIPESGEDIPVAEWQSMVRGRTVTYLIGGSVWAQEAYGRVGNGVSILLADGTCMEGVWEHTGQAYCFAWSGGEYSCFRHIRLDDQILIVPVLDGEPAGTVQMVKQISSIPLACGPALTS